MYKAVIFDLNGVFLQSQYLSKRFQESYGVSEDEFILTLKEIMALVRKPGAPPAFSLWKPCLESWNINLNEGEFFKFWFSGEKLVPELIEYANVLRKQKFKVFVLSNNFKERTKYYRENFPEIFNCVDKAYFSWETGFVKPSVESLNLVLSENNLKPEECIYFDDSNENIKVARELGIRAEKWFDLETAKEQIEGL